MATFILFNIQTNTNGIKDGKQKLVAHLFKVINIIFLELHYGFWIMKR